MEEPASLAKDGDRAGRFAHIRLHRHTHRVSSHSQSDWRARASSATTAAAPSTQD